MMTGLMGIITFGILAGIGLLTYFVTEYAEKKEKERKGEGQTPETAWNQILADYIGKNCEITVKEPLINIDVMHSAEGIIKDLDDEWLEMECEDKKGKKVKILRLDQVKGVKEIR